MKDDRDIKTITELMDDKFKGPLGFRFGLDGVIGLIPGVGDLITNFISFYIIARAALAGYPASVILRMCLNVVIENIVDWIPLFGNIFDFFWKSNRKNLQVIYNYDHDPRGVRIQSLVLVLSVFILAVFLSMAAFIISAAILIKLGSYVVGHIAI